MKLPRYNTKHKVLFKYCPPVAWAKFVGLQYVCEEFYLNTIDFNPLIHKPEFTYTGKNYNALVKHLFN